MNQFLRGLLVVLCLAVSSFSAGSITLGGGLNSSSTDKDDGNGAAYSNRWGYNIGVGLQVKPIPKVSYAFEANLETRGEDVTVNNGSASPGEISLRLLYMQIPVFLMVHVPAGRMTIDLFAGPVLGIPISGEIESPGFVLVPGSGDTPGIQYPAGKRQLEDLRIQFGAEAGVGLDIPWGSFSIFLRPSYYHGFTGRISEGQNMDDRQRNIKFKAGVQVPL